VDPRTWRQAIEKRLNELLDQSFALITALDLMEADCDLEQGRDEEESLGWAGRAFTYQNTGEREADSADDEPWLGSLDRNVSQVQWNAGRSDDREEENEHAVDPAEDLGTYVRRRGESHLDGTIFA